MKIGVVFPQTEFRGDYAAVRDYAQAVEALGYNHVMAYDHILGANPDRPGGWQGPYTHKDPFLEPFILFAYMAAATTTLGFLTGVIILPQRATAVVAKQAATLDVLSNGRLRLGVGSGWNKVEYIALNEDFHTRGRRLDEQIEVMGRLWTEALVTYEGRWHTIPDAGLNPLPLQRPIPIWFGGHADAVLRRVATVGAGWLPGYRTPGKARPSLEKIAAYMAAAGRNSAEVGLDPRIHYADGDLDTLARLAEDWQAAGATHITLNTMGQGWNTLDEHLAAIRRAAPALGVTGQAG